ncbi:bifunctional DNA-formamidopyrimidine glycosylase/DNA-(apurinic or apyrimidinic site) lyase [Ferruginivarius sediminum]|uniref:Formamidopyrimidine-DNA glycosylase n=1 Tax=Ferruginivarius sediminum TaxID=2661937 RepID=A0A369TCM3_9PROT|nr:bifunctional DNA-formamidopyrimidine glycosylase/DNA-(apurinic or apyrimidinic site) lyase [Ferruginivarius sediminum]RDD63083.1 bifunctional DNA-formamidopyrimidine glycosylase/DNA-(apurinic or apyrimidinic site) lyase [Ferruginivarius sediminum]
MPELPEVETVCRGLRPWLEGARLAEVMQRRADLRWPLPDGFAARLQGRRIERVERRAKYILCHLDNDEVLLAHLGMSGRMVVAADADAPLEPHDHIVLVTDAGAQVRFNDTRRFGMMDLVPESGLERHWLLKDLGPEPLGNAFNGPALAAKLAGRRTPIKAALLDQKTVAGLGNIYVCEALFFARLSPRRLAYTVQGRRAESLAHAVREVLTRAIAAGGSSLRDYRQSNGELGYFQHDWAVYDREGEACPGCDCEIAACGGIRRMVQSGRSTFYCPRRQR